MRTITRISFKLLDLLVIFVLAFGAPMTVLAGPSPTGATITSDLADYPPGATVTLTGAGWAADEAVHIFVNDDAGQTWSYNADVVADASGGFTNQFQLPNWFVANYSVTATGPTSGTATTSFTDLSIGTYDQCSNDDGDGYASGDTGCRWINGNLQSNNSTYFEGDSTVQRLWLTGFVPGSTHTVTFKYGTTKGGKHAYDFLTRWDWSESWITVADRCEGIVGCQTATDTYTAIPVDANANGYDVAADLIQPRQFTMRGGTLNSATPPTLVSGSYAGDSETVITVNFTVGPSAGSMCPTSGSDRGTCSVAIWFGAHVATQADWGFGNGAGSISGSPYHVALDAVDGASVGQRDNQMQANAIANGNIVIIKNAVPNDAQDFNFNINDGGSLSSDFFLDDDNDGTLSNSQTFNVPPGTWYVSELDIPPNWSLTDLSCAVSSGGTSTTLVDLGAATVTITLDASDTVTCTFTDEFAAAPSLNVTKTANPTSIQEPGGDVDFTVRVDNTGNTSLSLTSLQDDVYGDLNGQGDCSVPQTIALGGFYECTFNALVTGTAGSVHTDTVTATASGLTDSDDATVTITDVASSILVTKTANPTSVSEPGGLVTFTVQVDNTSSTDSVTITALTDDVHGDLNGQGNCTVPQMILPGDSYSCSFTATVSGNAGDSETDIATASGTDDDGNPVSDSDDATVTITDVAATMHVIKTAGDAADGDTYHINEPGDSVTFYMTVYNDSSIDSITIDTLFDDVYGDLNGQGDCSVPQTIPPGDSYSCSFPGIVTGNAGDSQTDTISASGTDDDGNSVSDTDDAVVALDDVAPDIEVIKTANPTHVPETGGNVTFTFLVENIGNENVTLTSLVDDQFGDLNGQGDCVTGGLIPAGGSYSCSITVFLSSDSLADHTNVVTAVGTDDDGTSDTDTDNETVSFDDVAPEIRITKSADPTHVPETGGNVTFTFLVENIGNEDVTLTSLTDTVFGDLNGQGDCDVPQSIAIGNSYSCSVTKFLSSDSLTNHYNITSATAVDDDGTPATDDDDETVTFDDVAPEIRITKSADPTHVPETGGNVTFTFLVENIGNEDVTLTSLSDTVFGDLHGQGDCSVPQSIAVGDSYSCSLTVFLSSDSLTDHYNVTTATAVDDDGTPTTDDDDETVTFDDVAPIVDLDKSVDDNEKPEPGGTFNYILTITNNSLEVVEITALTDTNALSAECLALIGTFLAPGEFVSCTYSATFTDAGVYPNTASVTVEDNEGSTDEDTDSETVTVTDVAPTVDLDKSVDDNEKPEPGGTFNYTLTISNTSVETVTITDLTDTQSGATDFSDCAALIGTTLAPGASVDCTYSVAHSDTGMYPNTAEVTVADDEGHEASDSDSETVEVINVNPVVSIVKSASPSSLPEPGGVFTFTLTITNNSNASDPFTITDLSDTQSGATDFSACEALIGTVLDPGESVSCSYTVTHTDAGSYDNTATVTGTDDEGNEASDSDDETVEVTDATPTVGIVKSVDQATLPEPGGVFTFTLTITNTSVESVTITELTDTQSGATDFTACSALVGTALAAGASTSCQYTVTHSDAGTYPNTAAVTVEDNEGNPASDSDDETVTVTDVSPVVDLTKTADPLTLPEPGGVFTFTLTITNNSVETVEITDLSDTQSGATDFSDCTALVGVFLNPNESISCAYTVTHTDAGTYNNTASVIVADDEGNEASDSDSETVEVTNVNPVVSLVKSASPSSLPEPGGVFTFTLTITNNSNASDPFEITSLTDTQSGATDFSDCAALVGTVLDPGESISCSYTVTHTDAGTYGNTASVTGTDDEGNEASDSDDETVTVENVNPVVSIVKSASPSSLPEPGGVFTFTLIITNDSNASDPFTITDLSDTQSGATDFSACEALIGTVLDPGESVSCSYTVTHTDAGSYDNTAAVTGTDDEGNETSDSDGETVTVENVNPVVSLVKTASPSSLPEPGGVFTFTLTITNNSNASDPFTITDLSDTQSGATDFSACEALIGTVLNPGESISCTYTVTHTDAGTYNNTATVTGTDDEGNEASDSDSETVEVTDVLPTIQLIKDASPSTLPEPGGLFTFTLSITNTSVETVTITALTDSNSLSAQCQALVGTTLAAGASTSCQYTVTHSDAGTYPNTAAVTVEDNEGNEASDDDSESVEVTDVMPTVEITKSATPSTLPEPGGVFTFTLTIHNTSVEAVTITALTDTNVLSAQCQALVGTTLAAGASTSCQYTVSHTDAGSYDNTASVTVEDNEGNPASDSDDETVTVTDVLPSITVDKTANPAAVPETGGDVTFTFVVTNNSVEPVTITSLSDSDFGTLTGDSDCQVGTGLAVGAFCTFSENHFIAGDFESGVDHINTFTTHAIDNENNDTSDTDDATVDFTNVTADIDVEKYVSVDNGATWIDADSPTGPFAIQGDTVKFKFVVTNNSSVTLSSITLTDSDFSLSGCTIPATLAAGASFECIIPTTAVTGQHTNTATASGSFTDGAGNTESDSDTDDANYYGLQRGQPSIQINSLSISINATRTTVTGQFNITDESQGGNRPDGFLIALTDYGLRWEQKSSSRNSQFASVVPSGGCTYTLISKDGVTYNTPLAAGEDIIFDETVTIGYTCTFGSTQLIRGGTLRGTAFARIFGRTGMEFTYSNTASIPR